MTGHLIWILLCSSSLGAVQPAGRCDQPVTTSEYSAFQAQLVPLSDTSAAAARLDSEKTSSIFTIVELCVKDGNPSQLSTVLAPEVYVNLKGTEGGYYSASQAICLLQSFFASRRMLSFKLSTINRDIASPFATGGGSCIFRGRREPLQIYVSLVRVGSAWFLSQFNVY